MQSSYTNLSTYRKCPRLYGFGKLGYKPIETPEAIQTGQFVHTAISAHFRGTDWLEAIKKEVTEVTPKLLRLDTDKQAKALKELATSAKRAQDLANRYIGQWAKDYKAVLIEPVLNLGSVVCHPDLIAWYQEERVVVDFKTSKSPDMRWYDVSGQVDLYAYVINEVGAGVSLIVYDVISDEGIYRHVRPPRLEAGHKLYQEVEALTVYSSIDWLLEHSHFTFDCPQRCQFWLPCWLLETADWSACEDYLESNFIKEVKSE